jgi:predicted transcriptional regulator
VWTCRAGVGESIVGEWATGLKERVEKFGSGLAGEPVRMSEVISFRVDDDVAAFLEQLAESEDLGSPGAAARALVREGRSDYRSALEIARLRVELARALSLEDELIGEASAASEGALPSAEAVAQGATLFSDTTVELFEPLGPAQVVATSEAQEAGDEGDEGPDRPGGEHVETEADEASGSGDLDGELFGEE